MNDLNKYGKPIRAYKGIGTLVFKKNNNELKCEFELVQLFDGRLYALCYTNTADYIRTINEQAEKLVGNLDDGKLLEFENLHFVHREFNNSKVKKTRAIVYGMQTHIKAKAFKEKLRCIRFGLTNFDFIGTEQYVIESNENGTSIALQLVLNLEGLKVVLRHVDNYRDKIEELEATRRVDITCEAIVTVDTLENEDKEIIIHTIDNLCLLLTLACGCQVTWLYYDVETSDGIIIESFHRSAITKPYGTLRLIPKYPPDDILYFINKAYPNFLVQESLWELSKAIKAYTDAKLQEDYIEARGLKMVVTMEHLKACYLRRNNKIYILPEKIFDKEANSLISRIRSILPCVFPDASPDELDLMVNHTKGFNWYPFGRSLSEICKSLGLQVNSQQRKKFVEIRNELVHKLSFNSQRGRPWEQYCLIMTFISKVLLAILGYDGYYCDWTKHHDYSEKRTKLDLIDCTNNVDN